MSRRQYVHRDPLGDKVCRDARNEAVHAFLQRIRSWPESKGQRIFFTELLNSLSRDPSGGDAEAMMDLFESSDETGTQEQWRAGARRAARDPAELLSWLYDGGAPAGSRCRTCGLRLDPTGQRGRPREYCGRECKNRALQKARQDAAKRRAKKPTAHDKAVDAMLRQLAALYADLERPVDQ